MEVATPPLNGSVRDDDRERSTDNKNNSTRAATEPAAIAEPGSGAAATAGAAARPGLRGRPRFTCAAPRPRAGHPAAAATAAPRARGAARRRGRRRAAVLAAAPGTCLALAAAGARAQVGTPRVGVGAIPFPSPRSPPASTLDFAGARRLPFLGQRRRLCPRPGAVGGCGPCAARAARHVHLPPRRSLRGTGRPGAPRGGPAGAHSPPGAQTPSAPAPSPIPELSRRKTPCTHLGMDGRLSHRLAKLLEGVHWSVGRFGHGVGAAFLLFNNVGSAGSAARVVGHVGTAEAGCCQYQGFLRILKL